jgi:UDP-N-acetylglucosamine 1-carboxyvinyltransferase
LTPGESSIEEGVFDDRLNHVPFLNAMGANISLKSRTTAQIRGVNQLVGRDVQATNIRSACAMVLAGLAAQGTTTITDVYHWQRGYGEMLEKLQFLGANICILDKQTYLNNNQVYKSA